MAKSPGFDSELADDMIQQTIYACFKEKQLIPPAFIQPSLFSILVLRLEDIWAACSRMYFEITLTRRRYLTLSGLPFTINSLLSAVKRCWDSYGYLCTLPSAPNLCLLWQYESRQMRSIVCNVDKST